MPKKVTTEIWVNRAIAIHGDKYDYSKTEYKGAHTKINIICKIHGEFLQNPSDHIYSKAGCPKCSNNNFKKTTTEFILDSEKIHGNKYNYSKVEYINKNTKVIIICPEHGEFEQTPDNHLNNKAGCSQCSIKYVTKCITKSLEQFIYEANLVHNNKYDYSLSNYINSNEKIIIICPIHGEFMQKPKSHLQSCGCPICSSSKGELYIRQWLLENNIEHISQYQIKLNEIVKNSNIIFVDFYIELNNKIYIIEYNGIQHYEYVPHFHRGGIIDFEKQKRRDKVLEEYCLINNINLINIKYIENKDNVIKKLNKLFNE